MVHEQSPRLTLPVSVVGRIDAGRLLREAEALDEFLNQAAIRQPGTPVKLPKTSRLLDETIEVNRLNVLQAEARKQLIGFLQRLKSEAPIIHVSFSADPSPIFTSKLMTWLRQEVHPLLLMQVGLQPNIGAGVIVRTPSRYYDFSLRQRFLAKHEELIKAIGSGTPAAQTVEADQQLPVSTVPAAAVPPVPAVPAPIPPVTAPAPAAPSQQETHA